jgi:hypothetical protein
MRKITQVFKFYAVPVLALLTMVGLLSPAASATDKYGQSEFVLSHVPITGPAVRQMFLTSRNGKHYLYIDQGEDPGVTVVDVTNPKNPTVVQKNIAWPGNTANGQLEILGANGDVAMSQVRENQQPPLQLRDINILDLTNPSHPRVLETFKAVTAVLPDNGRNLIYIANNEGISLVQHHVTQTGWAMQHECTSEAAISSMPPECY